MKKEIKSDVLLLFMVSMIGATIYTSKSGPSATIWTSKSEKNQASNAVKGTNSVGSGENQNISANPKISQESTIKEDFFVFPRSDLEKSEDDITEGFLGPEIDHEGLIKMFCMPKFTANETKSSIKQKSEESLRSIKKYISDFWSDKEDQKKIYNYYKKVLKQNEEKWIKMKDK